SQVQSHRYSVTVIESQLQLPVQQRLKFKFLCDRSSVSVATSDSNGTFIDTLRMRLYNVSYAPTQHTSLQQHTHTHTHTRSHTPTQPPAPTSTHTSPHTHTHTHTHIHTYIHTHTLKK